jgi:citrate synthase
MPEEKWKSCITGIEPNKILLRGYRLDELIGRLSFAETIFLVLKGELPSPTEARVLEAILVASVDHGVTPPSTLTARTVCSTGASFNSALAAGILAIAKHHGGAIEDCMRLLSQAVKNKRENKLTAQEAAEQVVEESRRRKQRLAGYGHRIHTDDPRTKRLLQLADECGLNGEYTQVARAIQSSMEAVIKQVLPINVDGAIACILCEMGIPAELGNAFFVIARVPGLISHIYEEMSTQKPMRRISPTDHEYAGSPERSLPR